MTTRSKKDIINQPMKDALEQVVEQRGGLMEMMRMCGSLDLSTGNIVISTGTIDIEAEVIEPKRLEP